MFLEERAATECLPLPPLPPQEYKQTPLSSLQRRRSLRMRLPSLFSFFRCLWSKDRESTRGGRLVSWVFRGGGELHVSVYVRDTPRTPSEHDHLLSTFFFFSTVFGAVVPHLGAVFFSCCGLSCALTVLTSFSSLLLCCFLLFCCQQVASFPLSFFFFSSLSLSLSFRPSVRCPHCCAMR